MVSAATRTTPIQYAVSGVHAVSHACNVLDAMHASAVAAPQHAACVAAQHVHAWGGGSKSDQERTLFLLSSRCLLQRCRTDAAAS
jgi:hypothetical protein